jgi:hypothetical protein
MNAIKGLTIKKREFSEVFYMQDEKRAILKIIPDKLSYWICTSDGTDKARIQETKEKFPDESTLETLTRISTNNMEPIDVS